MMDRGVAKYSACHTWYLSCFSVKHYFSVSWRVFFPLASKGETERHTESRVASCCTRLHTAVAKRSREEAAVKHGGSEDHCFLVPQNHFNLKSNILSNTNNGPLNSCPTAAIVMSIHESPLCSSSRPFRSNLHILLLTHPSSVHCPNHLRQASLTLSSTHLTRSLLLMPSLVILPWSLTKRSSTSFHLSLLRLGLSRLRHCPR